MNSSNTSSLSSTRDCSLRVIFLKATVLYEFPYKRFIFYVLQI